MVVLVVIGYVLGYIIELVMYWLLIDCIMVKMSWSCIGTIHNWPCCGGKLPAKPACPGRVQNLIARKLV